MSKILNSLSRRFKSSLFVIQSGSLHFRCSKQFLSYKTVPKLDERDRIGVVGWLLLIVPVSTFALGTWQWRRKDWKQGLIEELKQRTNVEVGRLPETAAECKELEYHRVCVRGHFLHDQEIFLGPRTRIVDGAGQVSDSAIFATNTTNQGYLVVTPFKLADEDKTILVNRGWIPYKKKFPSRRLEGQVDGVVDVVGIIRSHEVRPLFVIGNKPQSRIFFYRDLNEMCELTGADPVYIDATVESNVNGGPLGGQTLVTLRNEHSSYILTWYSLCGVTSFMWYKQFLKPAIR